MALSVATFNVLAPCFAQPSWYYPSSIPYMDTEFRRYRILQFLDAIKEYDIIALQEVTDDFTDSVAGIAYTRNGEYSYFSSLLAKSHYCFFVSHDRKYNASTFCPNPLSPYAWLKNGTALFIKRTTFSNVMFNDVTLGKGGCHAAMAVCVHRASGKRMRVLSVHLDNDTGGNRQFEWESIKATLPDNPNMVDLILGDFNTNTQTGILSNDFAKFNVDNEPSNKFKNALYKISTDTGLMLFEPTHPFTSTFNDGHMTDKMSHIVYRYGLMPSNIYYSGVGIYGTLEGTNSGVIDNNLWITCPDTRPPGYDLNEELRINTNLDHVGSDHFPVVAKFFFV